MEALKYVGMDVHKETIVIVVLNARGKQVMELVIETTAPAVRDFIQGIRGAVHVTFEEGTQAAWLYDLLRPLVAKVVVCDPRKNTLLLAGNKGDRVDAHKLAQLGSDAVLMKPNGWSWYSKRHEHGVFMGETGKFARRVDSPDEWRY
jgi:hypothetical protein